MITRIKNEKMSKSEKCNHKGYPTTSRTDYDIENNFTIITVFCDGCGNPTEKTITKTKIEKEVNQK